MPKKLKTQEENQTTKINDDINNKKQQSALAEMMVKVKFIFDGHIKMIRINQSRQEPSPHRLGKGGQTSPRR